MQFSLLAPDSTWAPPSITSLPSWANARRVAIDVETRDPTLKTLGPGPRRGAYLVGVSFAIEDGPAHYLPIRHLGGGNMDEDGVLRYLREQAGAFRGDLVGANLQYDLEFLLNEGIDFAPRMFRDVLVTEVLLDELQESYALDAVAKRHGLPGKDETLLLAAAREFRVNPKGGLWQMPATYVGAYAEQDVRLPLALLRRQESAIEDQGLEKIYALESKLIPVLVRMQRRGVAVDTQRLDEIEVWARKEELGKLDELHALTGVRLGVESIWKADELARALRAVGIEPNFTAEDNVSVDQEFLKSYRTSPDEAASGHPVAEAIMRARKLNKLRTTFVESVRKHMINGRIHPSFRQIARENEGVGKGIHGVRYGRMSCAFPNLQQQPSRDDFAARWRSIYRPDNGKVWASCDFKAQEPRWTTHFAGLLNLPKAREVIEKYRTDPTLDDHQFMADLTGLKRKLAKGLYLGICYGEGGAKVCHTLKLPTRWALGTGARGTPGYRVEFFATEAEAKKASLKFTRKKVWEAAGEEGQAILDQFNARVPYVRALAYKASDKAQERGYITTAGGRKLHFPQGADGNFEWTYKALNRLIQGSGADQVKQAMVDLDREMRDEFPLQLQVHDEVDSSVETVEIAHKAAEIMAGCMKAELPFRVDVETGPSWGEAK